MILLRIPAKVVCAKCQTTEDTVLEIEAELRGYKLVVCDEVTQVPEDLYIGQAPLPEGWEPVYEPGRYNQPLCPACKHGPRKV